MEDPIGTTITVRCPHEGHTLTVAGRHENYPGAFVLTCSCGQWTTLGEFWFGELLKEADGEPLKLVVGNNWSSSQPPITEAVA